MILNVSHLTKTFSGNAIITDASFFLNEKDKAAVVGLNGAGKTTLFNLIAGELTADSGDVSIKKGCTMGYLHQNNNLDSDLTILEELTQVIQPLLDLEARMRDLQEQMKHRQGAELEALYDAYSRMEQTYEQQDGYSARSRQISFFWTSPPTTWIWPALSGWRPTSSITRAPCSLFPTTGTFWIGL